MVGVLFILHNFGGGTERHVEDLIQALQGSIRSYVLKSFPGGFEFVDRTTEQASSYAFKAANQAEDVKLLRQLTATFGIKLIHVHHLITYPIDFLESISQAGVPYLFTAHDFFAICPSYTLRNANMEYCQAETNLQICQSCLQQQGNQISPAGLHIKKWRKRWSHFLKGAERVLTPSRATAETLLKYYPDSKVSVIEHGVNPFIKSKFGSSTLAVATWQQKYQLRVALLGAIGPHKGSRLLEELVELSRRDNLPIQWIVIGYTDLSHQSYRSLDERFIIHGQYRVEEIPQLLHFYQVDFVFFPSSCPETYSYTLSEVWLAGYPVIAMDIGALGERIREKGGGWLLTNLKPAIVIKDIMKLATNPAEILRVKKKLHYLELPSISQMGSEYLSLYHHCVATASLANKSNSFAGKTSDILKRARRFISYILRKGNSE